MFWAGSFTHWEPCLFHRFTFIGITSVLVVCLFGFCLAFLGGGFVFCVVWLVDWFSRFMRMRCTSSSSFPRLSPSSRWAQQWSQRKCRDCCNLGIVFAANMFDSLGLELKTEIDHWCDGPGWNVSESSLRCLAGSRFILLSPRSRFEKLLRSSVFHRATLVRTVAVVFSASEVDGADCNYRCISLAGRPNESLCDILVCPSRFTSFAKSWVGSVACALQLTGVR